MRRILILVALVMLVVPLASCSSGGCNQSNDSELVIRSPIRSQSTPRIQAQNFAIEVPAQRVYAPVPQVQRYEYAPIVQPRATSPCGGGTPSFSPPPVPADPANPNDPPESIPAFRR